MYFFKQFLQLFTHERPAGKNDLEMDVGKFERDQQEK